MPRPSLLRTIIIAALAMATLTAVGAAFAPDDETEPQRVILRVSRNLEIAGYVQLEEDEVIVVKDLRGEVHSFSKDKVLQIVRLVDPKPDQKGVIVLQNGQTQEGVIVEDTFDSVVFEIDGIRSKLRRDLVNYVLLEPSIDEQYRLFKERLEPGMHAQHYRLCQWLFEKREYELCRQELELLLDRSDMDEARRLFTIVDAQLALIETEDRAGDRPSRDPLDASGEPSAEEDEAASGLIPTADLLPQRILTREEVNLIRVMEIDFSVPPRISIRPETVRQLIETYREDKRVPVTPEGQARLYRTAADRPLDFLRLMFELRARSLYGEVEVLTEPRALNLFRQRVHNAWLVNNCATRRCHGGPNAGRFFLHRKGYKDERVRYTNLLILDRLELDPAWPMINYQEPMDSLMIQHALARDVARKPHPDVHGWKPVFTPGNRRLLEDSIAWIQAMMSDPRPDYPIDYEPPMLNVLPEDENSPKPGSDRVDR